MFSKDLTKKVCLAVLMTGAFAVLSGCSGRSGETAKIETVASAETETTAVGAAVEAAVLVETETDHSGETTAAVQTKKADNIEASVRMLTGKVTDAGTSTVTIVSDRYPDGITFSKEDAATQFENGLLLDQEITIFYQGEIKNGNTSETTVPLIRDKRDKDAESQAAMISGRILGIGMSVVTIETPEGKNISFEQDPKPVNLTEGPEEGETVTILYSYRDEGGDGAVVPELIR